MNKSKLLGIIARDGTGWQSDFEKAVQEQGYGVMWKDQLSDMFSLLSQMREIIDEKGFITFYNVSNNYTNYVGRIIDFAINDDYERKRKEWKLLNPAWFCDSFDDYVGDNNKAVIVFLVDSFMKIQEKDRKHIELFETFNDKIPSRKNAVAFTSILTEDQNLQNNMIDKINNILIGNRNLIIQGAPGTGKTYSTATIALSICGIDTSNLDHEDVMIQYNKLHKQGRIEFVTFHQSMDYEDFIEGIKPSLEDGRVSYEIEDGIFKRICKKASSNVTSSNFDVAYKSFIDFLRANNYEGDNPFSLETSAGKTFGVALNSKTNLSLFTGKPLKRQGTLTKEKIELRVYGTSEYDNWDGYYNGVLNILIEKYGLTKNKIPDNSNYVLIIDEINRGNISKIFGELITLLEYDKRFGEGNHTIKARLPYSKEEFSVPSNLYIIGTMNTTDRSVGTIDYAIRRRFAFYSMESNPNIIKNHYIHNHPNREDLKSLAIKLFNAVKSFIIKYKIDDMAIEDLMVGHSYFMIKNNEEDLSLKWKYEIYPLLKEYYKDGICSKEPEKDMNDFIKSNETPDD